LPHRAFVAAAAIDNSKEIYVRVNLTKRYATAHTPPSHAQCERGKQTDRVKERERVLVVAFADLIAV